MDEETLIESGVVSEEAMGPIGPTCEQLFRPIGTGTYCVPEFCS